MKKRGLFASTLEMTIAFAIYSHTLVSLPLR